MILVKNFYLIEKVNKYNFVDKILRFMEKKLVEKIGWKNWMKICDEPIKWFFKICSSPYHSIIEDSLVLEAKIMGVDWGPLHVLWLVSFGCWVTWSISSWQEYHKSVFFFNLTKLQFLNDKIYSYRISANSFRGNYSFLNLSLCTVTFDHSTYRCGNYSREETICGNTVY